VGLKPTYGSVSRHGLIAMASSLDQIGPIVKSVEDAALVFDALKGKDVFDATTAPVPDTKTEFRLENLQGIRVGIPKEYFVKGLDKEVEAIIRSTLKKMEGAGAELIELSLPHLPYALATYYIVVPSEVSANLARFDGIRYGYQHPANSLYETYTLSRQEALGLEVKRRIMIGTYALSAGYYDAYYLKAQKVRRLIRDDFAQALEKVDVIAGPTTPTPAFKIGEKVNDPVQMYLEDIYTVAINLAGIPSISLPAGSVERGGKTLPVGVQLIGLWFQESKLLNIAKVVESLVTPK
jgi:aspartyl-tRNA(Asn)/glutamyl-tRNA(Gln) amidotransferase subunit A